MRTPYTSGVRLRLFSSNLVGFVLGLLFGSFLNVCIARLPEHESVVTAAVAVHGLRASGAVV